MKQNKDTYDDSFIDEFLNMAAIKQHEHVLNIGPSSSSIELPSHLAKKSGNLLCVDTRVGMVNLLKTKNLKCLNNKEITIDLWNEQDGIGKENQFDVVVLYGTINSVFNPGALLRQVAKCMKDDGRLLWAGLGVPEYAISARMLLRSFDEYFHGDPELRRPVVRRYTIEKHIIMAFDAGFKFRSLVPFNVLKNLTFSISGETNEKLQKDFSEYLIQNADMAKELQSPAIGFFSVLCKDK